MQRIIRLTVVCAVLAMHSTLWALTADEVAQRTDVGGGLCSFPRFAPGDERLAIELAGKPTLIVHVLAQDAAATARIRELAEAAGLLGRSMYVENGQAIRLPMADRMVDLLIATDLRDADLTPELRAEWLRVLTPRRGAAIVGRAKANGAGLTAEALKTWAKDLPLAKVVADDTGVWAVLHADLPAGSDPWSHRTHGADNSQVSNDATLKPPFLAQWWGMPRQEGFWGTTVIAGNGRLFSLRASRDKNAHVFLTARSVTNGLVLWQKRLRQESDTERNPHGGYLPGRSCVLVAGDVLYLADRDGVLRLNAETGAQLGRLAGPKKGGQVKWIGFAGGLLTVLAGEPDTIVPIAYQTVSANPNGRELAAYDGEKELWHETLGGDVDERMIAVRDDRVYTLTPGIGVQCRELRTGKVAWVNPDTDLQAEFRVPESKALGQYLYSQPNLMAVDDVILLRAVWAKNIASLSRVDGKLLWRKPSGGGGRALTSLAVNGQWLGARGAIDLKTGQPAPGPRFVMSGCGPTTAVPGYLITCFGTVADMKTGKVLRPDDIKSPCDVGSFASEGMMITVPSECQCGYELKGYRVLAPAGAIQPHAATDAKARLTTLETAEPTAMALTDADWPTYRRDAARSGASTATVGDNVKVLWRWRPATADAPTATPPATAPATPKTPPLPAPPRLAADFIATAPVAAAGFVWFVSHDGVVRCLKADSGEQVWSFATAGMAFAPPTIWQGRTLVGGGDGKVYCLDATTGKCLWQLQTGPVDRRVFWFGHLISTWPVMGGVAVRDGVGYAVAGFQAENGIHAYAFDPKTGQVKWEKHDAGSGGAVGPNAGYSAGGHVAVGGGRLWLCSSTNIPGSFELATGEFKPLGRGAAFGSEVGVFDGKWVMQGGRRLSETQDTLGKPLGGSGFGAVSTESTPPRVPLTGVGTALPAWDAELAIMPPMGTGGVLTAVPTDKLLGWLAGRAAPAPAKPKTTQPDAAKPAGPPAPKAAPVEWAESKLWTSEGPGVTLTAFALAKDVVVVAHASALAGGGFKGSLTAFRRTDGTKAWSIDLPDQAAPPAMNRLAIDNAGRVLVSLCDGSVICVGR